MAKPAGTNSGCPTSKGTDAPTAFNTFGATFVST